MATLGSTLLSIIAPKKSARAGGIAATPTFNPQQTDRILTLPQYREHLTDIFTSRSANDSRSLLRELMRSDPDVSAAVFSYLTMANTLPLILVKDMNGQIDPTATAQLHQMIKRMTVPFDYTLGFQMKHTVPEWCEELRYMCMLRGAIGVELVLDKGLLPADLRNIDMSTVEWFERKSGDYKPVQRVSGVREGINLDIPTFFVAYYKQDPTTIYPYSTLVSAVNTIAARQQVINDIYRIMQKTGYPRMDVKIVEEVLIKNVPPALRTDDQKRKAWMDARLSEVRVAIEGIRPDQAFVHWDSVEAGILNDRTPGMAVDISAVIETLNAQNQAGLKTMATVIGRGQAGVNTGSVEARIAAMNADELNIPIAAVLSNVFSFMMHQTGYQGFAEVTFKKAELRPELELEPQLMLRSSRLRQDLSDGLITDVEYHLQMYNRLPPDGAPELSGTKFAAKNPDIEVQAEKVSPNSDPLGRSLAPEGGQAARSSS